MTKLEFVIWGEWASWGDPEYELLERVEGKLVSRYGGVGGYKFKDCKNWLNKRYPNAKIKYHRASSEWNVDVIIVDDKQLEEKE